MKNPSSTHWDHRIFGHRALAGLLAGLGIFALSGSTQAGVTSLRLSSQPGDGIGGGQDHFFAATNGTFTAQGSANHVSVSFHTPSYSQWWDLDFAAPNGQPLAIGSYLGGTRYPFEQSTEPGLNVDGDGLGCNTLTGSFEIKEVDVSGGTINHFWATFEQHCDGAVPALFGEIRYNADVILDLGAPASVQAGEGQALSVDVVATEALNRHVTLTASNVPAGAQFTDHGNSTGTLTWTPPSSAQGSYTVTFGGDNGAGTVATANTHITVLLANDDFDHPTVIASLPFASFLNTGSATTASDDPNYSCGYNASRTVWYSLTLDRNTHIEADTFGSDYNTILSVYTGSRGTLTLVACDPSEVKFGVDAGKTYYFMVSSSDYFRSGSNLVFNVNELLPPPNDDIAHATPVVFFPGTNTIDTLLATRASDDPANCIRSGPTVWYSFAPTEDTFLNVQTLGYGASIGGYVGSRGALQPLFCFGGEWGLPTFAGNTYYFMLGSDDSTNLQYGFLLHPHPLLKIGVTIDAVGSVDHKTGVATVSGTVSSSQPVTICVGGVVRQKVGRLHIISATFGNANVPGVCVQCSGRASWSAQVLGDSGSFGGGAALVAVSASAIEPISNQYVSAQASATVQLTGSKK